MIDFKCIPPNDFVLLAVLIGIVLAQGLSSQDQGALGSFIELIGETISTISEQTEFIDDVNNNGDEASEDDIKILRKELEDLKKKIEKL